MTDSGKQFCPETFLPSAAAILNSGREGKSSSVHSQPSQSKSLEGASLVSSKTPSPLSSSGPAGKVSFLDGFTRSWLWWDVLGKQNKRPLRLFSGSVAGPVWDYETDGSLQAGSYWFSIFYETKRDEGQKILAAIHRFIRTYSAHKYPLQLESTIVSTTKLTDSFLLLAIRNS